MHCSSLNTICSWLPTVLAPPIALLLFFYLSWSSFNPVSATRNSFGQQNSSSETLDIIKARGFIGEHYRVISRDGYPLSVYHIINPLANQQTLNKYPVLILHGLGGDSSQMVSHSASAYPRRPVLGQINYDLSGDENLAFMLSNNNFDVWLSDARGGSNLNDHEASVWNFTLDEQVLYDIPTVIDFVLEQTQADKLNYVGYSESTFFLFAYLSVNPAYQTKLASFIALAPVAYVSHITGMGLTMFAPVSLTSDQVGWNYLPQPMMDSLGFAARELCSQKLFMKMVCYPAARTVAGPGVSADGTNFFTTLFKGASTKTIKHFLQLYLQKRFGMYDYGPQGNLVRYGQTVAPNYNLQNVTLPTIVLIRGGQDFLSTPQDQLTLIQQLGTKPFLDIYLPNYNHLDFIIAKNILLDINLPIAKVILTLSNHMGDTLTYPTKVARKHRPTIISIPNGSRRLDAHSHLNTNLFDGMFRRGINQPDLINSNLLQGVGEQIDSLSTSVNRLPKMILSRIIK